MIFIVSGLFCLLVFQSKNKRTLIVQALALILGTTLLISFPIEANQSWAAVKANSVQGRSAKKANPPAEPQQTASQANSQLAALDYAGTQTIEVNQNTPTFTTSDLSLKYGAWEKYGDLDQLNRATSAEALLNQSLMPTTKRKAIANVKPTGWHSKKINGTYLYNRSHLIGYTLAGENANWKNLITGTRQLNSPEMLRFELDIKAYLMKDTKRFVRYSVTPIFRGDELLARGVHLMAQSVTDNEISFNIYIFNVQTGVSLNYADGTSQVIQATKTTADSATKTATSVTQPQVSTTAETSTASSTGAEKTYVDANGNGLIKGSRSGIYHLPGSQYYNRTTNPTAWFKTISEAQQAGYRAPR